jgi:hypothetical protein
MIKVISWCFLSRAFDSIGGDTRSFIDEARQISSGDSLSSLVCQNFFRKFTEIFKKLDKAFLDVGRKL